MDNSAKGSTPNPPQSASNAEPRAAARAFLERTLQRGSRPAVEIRGAAEKAGIAPAALKRARRDLGVSAEKKGFGAGGEWLLSLGALGAGSGPNGGGSPLGWGLLAAGAVAFGLAYFCIEANCGAAERGGCPQAATAGFPAPPGAEPRDCCPRWFIVALIAAGLILVILGLMRV